MKVGGVNEKGEKILKIVEKKNYKIVFVEQENLNNNIDELYESLANILRKQTTSWGSVFYLHGYILLLTCNTDSYVIYVNTKRKTL